ncbi:pilus assembly protein PilP [Kaarinaea lacus]
MVVTFSACNHNNVSDLQTYIAKVKANPQSNIEPLPNVLSYASYTYDDMDLRNPFNPQSPPPIDDITLCTEINRARDALEDIPLEALTLVGSLEQDGVRWGLIRTRDGTIYRRKPNDYTGKDNGHITQITETSLELLELIPQGSGCVKKTTILTMNE